MLQRELVKTGVSALGGLALGGILALAGYSAMLLLVLPLYAVGFVYGAGHTLRWAWGAVKGIGKVGISSLIFKNLIMALLALVFLPVVLAAVLAVGWVVGIVLCIGALIKAGRGGPLPGAGRTAPFSGGSATPPGGGNDWD